MDNIRAYFIIAGFEWPPDEVSRHIPLNPDGAAAAGELRRNQAGIEYRVKDSYWEVRSTITEPYEIAEYVDDLVEKIRPVSGELLSLRSRLGPETVFKIVVAIAIEPEKSRPGMYLEPQTMKFLGDHGIVLEVDIN